MLLGEVACWSLLGVSGLRCIDDDDGNDATLFENKFQKTFGCQINGLLEIHHTYTQKTKFILVCHKISSDHALHHTLPAE